MFEVRIRDEAESVAKRLCQWPATKPISELLNIVRAAGVYVDGTTVPPDTASLHTQFVLDEDDEWAFLEIIVGRDDKGEVIIHSWNPAAVAAGVTSQVSDRVGGMR